MKILLKLVMAITILFFSACQDKDILNDISEGIDSENYDYADWSIATHTNEVDPDFTTVFNQEEVLRLDIKISSENWTLMQEDLTSLYGTTSGPGGSFPDENPIWVESSVFYNGVEWYHVGVRFKGNSSLQAAYRSGNNKLSLKLDFDEFEDDYPIIDNQRFYGFKQLNLNNNYDDQSLMREKIGSDLFRNFGLPAAHTSFCIVYLDNGSGSKYYGVYTLVEEVDDTVIEEQFISDSGNLYKPDGDAASFASGSFNTDEMELKTNEEVADYTDVETLYTIINSNDRLTDNENWQTNLEGVFDVDNFLRWLAANTIIQNWDTYGIMTHNYFLYSNPANDLLTWIPWDNNEAFQDGKMGGALSISLSEVSSSWPLIRYIIDQPGYQEKYQGYLNDFVNNIYTSEEMNSLYATYHDMIAEYAYAEESGYSFIRSDAEFDNAIEELKSHVVQRNLVVADYLE